MRWQVQEAKQRFSELLRRALDEGPQFVTRHGEEVAIVMDIAHYRELSGSRVALESHLLHGPKDDEFADLIDTVRASLPDSSQRSGDDLLAALADPAEPRPQR